MRSEPFSSDGTITGGCTPHGCWFMIAGGDPEESGFRETMATYKGATPSYVDLVP